MFRFGNKEEDWTAQLVDLCRKILETIPLEGEAPTRPFLNSTKIIPALVKIALITCVFFSVYELAKQLLFHNLGLWQSHVITVVFATIVAPLGAYFPLRKIEILYRRSVRELIERKRAQNILQESEERYRHLFERESDALFLVHKETDRILEVNPAGIRLYGYSREELLKMSFGDLTVREMPSSSENAGYTPRLPVFIHKTKQGLELPIEIALSTIKWGGQDVRLAALRDVTGSYTFQQELERQRSFFRKVIDTNPNYIYVKDRENRIVLANARLAERFQMTPPQLIGRNFIDFMPDRAMAESANNDDREILGRKQERIEREEHFLETSGEPRFWYTIKVPIKGSNNAIEQVIGVSTDITERKLAEEALKRRDAELEENSRHLEETNTALKVLLKQRDEDRREIENKFLSNVKDTLLPYIEKLKKSPLDEEQKACLEILEKHLQEIISPFLTKITSRYLNLTPKEIQIVSLIKDGKSTKEIAMLLNISPGAVDLHRNHIRGKLGLKNKNINLRSYLISLP